MRQRKYSNVKGQRRKLNATRASLPMFERVLVADDAFDKGNCDCEHSCKSLGMLVAFLTIACKEYAYLEAVSGE
jgi:hypothetical protein